MTDQPSPTEADWIRAAKVCREVAELPDRTSPEENADFMLVTGDELQPMLAEEFADVAAKARAAAFEWRPIETAPERRDILLATASGYIFLAKWNKEPDKQWCKHGHSMPYLPNIWTHWMPLPDPPNPLIETPPASSGTEPDARTEGSIDR